MIASKIIGLIDLVRHTKIYDLAQPVYEKGPVFPYDPPYYLSTHRDHKQTMQPNGLGFAVETIFTSTHVSTHIDAMCHMARNGKMFNNVDASSVTTPTGFTKNGIEQAPLFVIRGVLLDLPRSKGELPENYQINGDDLEQARNIQGTEISAGDAVLVRTGYGKYFNNNQEKYMNAPGISQDGARWIVKNRAALSGTDNIAYEVNESSQGEVHLIMIPDNGVYIIENLFLDELSRDKSFEFLLIVLPLKLVGATGSLIRPIAITPQT